MMRSEVEENFSNYYEKWMLQLEECVKLLLIVPKDTSYEREHDVLVGRLTSHYKNYYTAKWAAAREDVLAFYAPVWLTPLEKAYLWVTGWKPSMAFQLVTAVTEMTEEEARKVGALRAKIKSEEEKVEREMERQQVSMADRKMVELARVHGPGQLSPGHGSAMNDEDDGVAVKNMVGGLEKVMKMADCVRLKTLKGLLDLLGPTRSIQFLASASMIQIQMRKRGKTQKYHLNNINNNNNNNHLHFVTN